MTRPIFFLAVFLAAPVLAQDDATDDAPETEAESESVDDSSGVELPDLVLDGSDDHTKDDEDVFVPTDEISFQQSIPFPTDI